MKEKCANLWQKLSTALKPQVSADTFKRWFSGLELIDVTEESLTFRVPNNIYQFWIESNHMVALQAAIVKAFGGPRQVSFSSPTGTPSVADLEDMGVATEMPVESDRHGKTATTLLGLNPRNTFESFVVGPNNEIAHAASL